jgi:hypothetical protein
MDHTPGPQNSSHSPGNGTATPAAPKKKRPKLPARRPNVVDTGLTKVRPWLIAGAFVIAAFVALSPSVGYAPVPRVVLFFVLAFLFTLVSVGELDARFEMKLPGFLFSSTGVLAAMCGLLLLLNHLAAPEVQATRFTLRYKGIHQLALQPKMIEVKGVQGFGHVPHFVDGEDLFVIYPQGVTSAEVRINPLGLGWFHKELSYAGNRKVVYQIDSDFTPE